MRIWHSLRGYVMIKIEGINLERFLNICMLDGIDIWDVNRKSRTVMYAKVNAKHFYSLKSVRRKCACKISIVRRSGSLFLLKRFKARKILMAGITVAIALVYLLSSYVWSIEIVGVEANELSYYYDQLHDQGVNTGTFSSSIDTDKIESYLVNNNEDVVWASATISGVKLSIEIIKETKTSEVVDNNTPASIVSTKDAVVDSMIILEGRRVVQDGTTVVEGQELVSGTILYEGNPSRQVHAQADIVGRVWYSETVSIPTVNIKKTDTGNTHKVRYLCIGGTEIAIDDENNPYENFRVETNEYDVLDKGLYITARVKTICYYEQNVVEEPIDIEKLRKDAEEKAWEKVQADIPTDARIQNTDYVYKMQSGKLFCEAKVETLENIGKTIKINTQ